jgi:hypothetical protein
MGWSWLIVLSMQTELVTFQLVTSFWLVEWAAPVSLQV